MRAGYLSHEGGEVVVFEKDRKYVLSEFGWFLNQHSAAVGAPANVFLISWIL